MATVEIDFAEYKEFFEKLARAGNRDFRKELETWLEGLGIELLRIIEDEIIRREVVDTRLLLHSFTKGNAENIWEISDGGLKPCLPITRSMLPTSMTVTGRIQPE